MSEFSSLLASFKQNATAASSNRPSSRSPSSSTPAADKQPSQPRKRQYQKNGRAHPSPSFPSMHSHARRKGSFEMSFLVIGAQKAGTSWLHALLQKCDRVSLPREQKEVHFWDWHHRKGFDWYIHQFDFLKKSHHSSCSDNPLYGEITPCYVVLHPSTIAEIRKCYPEIKLVFIARDLVDRAWSAMIMELRDQTMGLNAGEFAEGVVPGVGKQQSKRAKKSEGAAMSLAQQRRLQRQSSPSSQPDSYYLDRLRSETHSSRSDYATHMSNWYSDFPAESILIVDFNEIEMSPRNALLKIAMHIGVGEEEAKAYVAKLSDEDVEQRVNSAPNVKPDIAWGDASGMQQMASSISQHSLSHRPRLRKQMQELLRPYAKKFNLLLSERGYGWKINEYTG